MSDCLGLLREKLRSISSHYCENQLYVWPGFNPEIHDPDEFFASRDIEFDGELFIRYRVERTFRPLTAAQIAREERLIGAKLPADYTAFL